MVQYETEKKLGKGLYSVDTASLLQVKVTLNSAGDMQFAGSHFYLGIFNSILTLTLHSYFCPAGHYGITESGQNNRDADGWSKANQLA